MKIYMPSRIVDGQVGGNTTYARNIREGLRAQGHQVESIPASNHPVLTMLKETSFGLRKPQGSEELIHYVADTGPLLQPRYPSVVTVHGIASRWIDVARSKQADFVWRTRVQKAIDLSKAVITVSQSSARDVAAVFGIEESEIAVIPHGINHQIFETPTVLSQELQRELGRPFILYLGNIEPRKNLVALIKAFASKTVQDLGYDLVIAGKPAWDFEETMQMIQQTPNVKHLGFVSDEGRRALMQQCSLFVFPSLYEGFGFPVLEALSAGAVVLCSDRGSLAEVAGPAIRLESCDPEGIEKGLIQALTNQKVREVCLETGREWSRKFSWENSVQAHIDIYRKVLGS